MKEKTIATKKPKLNFEPKKFKASMPLYLLLIPAMIVLILFNYIPMYGVQIAFRNYSVRGGITGSDFVGLYYFKNFINSARFTQLIGNTLSINILSLCTFPLPIIFALMLNDCKAKRFKKAVQMATYAPYFISVIVVVSMLELFLSPTTGIINTFIKAFGGSSVYFMAKIEYFRSIYVLSDLWQSLGWSSIIYIGALSGVSPDLHEAAVIDGANKLQRMWHVDIPGISPIIITMFILRFGQLMNLGFQKALLMQNDINITVSEIISTYVYSVGLLQNNFSYSTAIDLFNTTINIILLIIANTVAKKCTSTSIF